MRKLATLFIALLFSSTVFSYVSVSGNVSGTWSMGTYYVTGNITVQNGSTLTIQAGVVVKFAPNTYLQVYGTIYANGTSGSQLVFTSRDDNSIGEIIPSSDGNPQKGDWDGIQLYGFSDNLGIGYFDYARIEYGGRTSGSVGSNILFNYSDAGYFRNSISGNSQNIGFTISNCSPEITNSTITSSNNYGLFAQNSSAPTITNNVFTNNGSYAVYLDNITLNSYNNNTGTGNAINGFGLRGTVTGNSTWSCASSSFPFILIGTVTVNSNINLALEPGTIIKGNSTSYFMVYGRLDVNGTIGNNVILTSINDDDYGGDTKGDGNATPPAPGDWDGICLDGFSSNKGIGYFDYTRVRYGGRTSGNTSGSTIYFYYSDSGYFKNSNCEYSQQNGLRVNTSSPEFTYNTISNSGNHGIYATNSSQPIITNNVFTNNGSYAAYLDNITLNSYNNNTGTGNTINGFGLRGTVTGNSTWSCASSNFPYILTGTVIIYQNDTLTLEPGTIIKGNTTSYFMVYGILESKGTSGYNVILTSINDDNYGGDTKGDGSATPPAPGDWDGICLDGFSSNKGIGYFDYTRVRYGGRTSGNTSGSNIYFYYSDSGYFKNSNCEYSQQNGLSVNTCSPEFTYSTISNSGNHGIYASNSSKPIITNNVFTNNGSYAAYLENITLNSYNNNTGKGNATNGFGLRGTVSEDLMWSCASSTFPYILIGTVTINNDVTLKLEPGTILKGIANSYFMVYGKLDAQGKSDSNVIFTSINDDDYGGDTKGDGSATPPAPGDWDGIYLYGYSSNKGIGYFNYTRIRYGGRTSGNTQSSNIYMYYSDSAYFKHSSNEYSQNYGLRFVVSSPEILANTFSECGNYALNGMNINSKPEIDSNLFINNSQYAVYLDYVTLNSYTANNGINNGNGFGVYGIGNDAMVWSSASPDFPFVVLGNINSYGNLTIPYNTRLKFANKDYYIFGSGTFTLNGIIEVISSSGLYATGAAGHIQTSGRVFNGQHYIYNGTVYQAIGSVFSGDVNIQQLTINNSLNVGGVIGNFRIIEKLSLTNGQLNTSSYTLYCSNDATISRSNGTLSKSPSFDGMINMEYTNTSTITTDYELPTTDIIYDFTKSGIGQVNLNRDVKVNDTLSLNAGIISTDIYSITLGSSTSNLGTLIRTEGKIVGNFKRWFAGSTVNNVLFPVGTTDYYRSANISFTAAPTTGGTITTSFTSSNPGSNGLPLNDGGTNITNIGFSGYWTMTSGDGLAGGTYNLDLTGQGFASVHDYTTLHLLKRINSGNPWTLQGTHSPGTGSNSNPTIHRTGMSGFSEFAIGSYGDNLLTLHLNLKVFLQGAYR